MRKPKKPCRYPGCGRLVELNQPYCDIHEAKMTQLKSKESYQRRGSASKQGYNGRWRKVRKIYLTANPLCVYCEAVGRLTPATVIDHKTPHRGDMELFWDENNWAACCKPCHDRKTVAEDGGFGKPRK